MELEKFKQEFIAALEKDMNAAGKTLGHDLEKVTIVLSEFVKNLKTNGFGFLKKKE